MCGFIGFISDINDKQNSFFFEKFQFYLNELNNRGPDYSEVKKIIYKNKLIYVGFKRLAIQDLGVSSNKIFCDDDNLLLFNGEIYNKKELKEKYLLNSNLETNTDTEVLFTLLNKFDTKIISEIQGIFSIVYINFKKQTIECIRDYTGTKPLYYKVSNENFFFSSEAWFLYSLSEKKIDNKSLQFYLNFGFCPEENTLIKNVKKVKPRSNLKINFNDFKIKNEIFLDLSLDKQSELKDQRELNNIIENTVKLNLLSDTKVGTFLSGGIDSSIVTALAKKYNDQVESFTTVYLPQEKYKKFNLDYYYAKRIANDLKIKLNINYIENFNSIIEDFYKVSNYLDEPISNMNFLNTYWQSKFAKEKGFKVVLTGDGSDELFCGYDRYEKIFISEKLKFLNLFNKKINAYNSIEKENLPDFFYSVFKSINYKELLNKDITNSQIEKKNMFEELKFSSKADLINYFDFRYWLTNESNYKLDKCTMINSVEARIPFQDISLIKKLFFIKNEKKYKFFSRKFLLKNNNLIPSYIKNRKKNGWFTPDNIFLEKNLNKIVNDIFLSSQISEQGIFDKHKLIEFFKSFDQKGYRIKREIITIVLFQIWFNKVLKC